MFKGSRRSSKPSKLSIIVPVFNEGSHIIQNLDLLLDEVEAFYTNFEIIVVSDGSTDNTNTYLSKVKHPGVKPIFVMENAGKGNAVREGFHQATGDYIMFIDGGMEIHPKEIRIFMGLMSLYDSDIVIGSKRHPQSKVHYPWYRRLLSWMFQVFIRALFKIEITDTQVGIKLFRSEVIAAVLPHLEINRYGFDLEILLLAKRFGFGNILEAPIRLDYFSAGKRHIPRELLHVFKVGLSLIKDTVLLYFRMRDIAPNSAYDPSKVDKRAG